MYIEAISSINKSSISKILMTPIHVAAQAYFRTFFKLSISDGHSFSSVMGEKLAHTQKADILSTFCLFFMPPRLSSAPVLFQPDCHLLISLLPRPSASFFTDWHWYHWALAFPAKSCGSSMDVQTVFLVFETECKMPCHSWICASNCFLGIFS